MRALNESAAILHRCLWVQEDLSNDLESIGHLPSCSDIGTGLALWRKEMALQNIRQ
jgi:hypothetical protein